MPTFISLILSLLLIGCGGASKIIYPATDHSREPIQRVSVKSASKQVRFPWEAWPLRVDLNGNKLNNLVMLSADDKLSEGDRKTALDLYWRVDRSLISEEELKALMLRISSSELALDRPTRALAQISNYFRERNLDIEAVDLRFSLILAYAYARKGDIEQSLAWFSRANRVAPQGSSARYAVQTGLGLVAQSQTDQQLESLSLLWESDALVSQALSQERNLRQRRGFNTQAFNNAFWGENAVAVLAQADQDLSVVKIPTVTVLLPLSGKYQALGRTTLNGLKMVFGDNNSSIAKLDIRDTAGDPIKALEQYQRAMLEVKPILVLGPLLSDEANALVAPVNQSDVPLITFAKRSDFAEGGNIIRFGPDLSSQVRSLVLGASRYAGLKRFALVYPDTETGREFADYFKRELATQSLELTFESPYAPGDIEAPILIAKSLEGHRLDGVFMPDSVEKAVRLWSNLPLGFRANTRILGPASWEASRELTISRKVLDRALYVSAFMMQGDNDLIRRFEEGYQANYRSKPDFLAAQAFDAATLVAAAIGQSRERSFLDALRSIDEYDGLTGYISINQSGQFERRFRVAELREGKALELKAQGPWAENEIDPSKDPLNPDQSSEDQFKAMLGY